MSRLIIILLLITLILNNCTPAKKPDQEKITQNELPDITLTIVQGPSLKSNSLVGPVILIFFGPDCDHCQRQAESIQKKLDIFKNYSLYFIASNPDAEIISFAKSYQLQGYSNIFFARAEIAEVIDKMGPMSIPGIFIYSADRQLIKKFNGETPVDEIAKFL